MQSMIATHGAHSTTHHGGFHPIVWLKRAFAVRAQRTRLEDLDDYLLRDIGVDREVAQREATRPFWDLPR